MKMINYIIPILIIISVSFLYSFFKTKDDIDISNLPTSLYEYPLISIDGEVFDLNSAKGKKILIVNVASKCGYTYQYEGLQKLYEKYSENLIVLGFPANDFFQEPGKNNKIKNFCSTKYGVTFPMFEKTDVKKSDNQNPVYVWLSNKELNGWNDKSPSWNFCKYLVDEKGNLVEMFAPSVKPFDSQIIKYLK